MDARADSTACKDGQRMSDVTLTASKEITETTPRLSLWQKYEFLVFSIAGFVAKSYLLVRMPYREWYINTTYTTLILAYFYCYFRFRLKAKPPLFTVFCMAFAVGIDVLGNLLNLYGKAFFGIQYDE